MYVYVVMYVEGKYEVMKEKWGGLLEKKRGRVREKEREPKKIAKGLVRFFLIGVILFLFFPIHIYTHQRKRE